MKRFLFSNVLFKSLKINHFNIFVRHISVEQNIENNRQNESEVILSHRPVMGREIMEVIRPKDGQTFIDMTFGGGGHTKHLLASNKKIKIYALDRDPIAYQKALLLSQSKLVAANGQKIIPLLGRFSEFAALMAEHNVKPDSVDGVIMDLGASSMQFDDHKRGFALSSDGPLDMRMDGQRFENMPTAADVVNTLSADQLAKIFKIYGEERYSMKIAQTIVDSRFLMKSLSSTRELANLVANISSNYQSFDRLGRPQHSATKVFMALRIFVNNEINELNYGLEKVRHYLKPTKNFDLIYKNDSIDNYEDIDGGVIAVISFHSLEDKIVKKHLSNVETNHCFKAKHFSSLEVPSEKEITEVMTKNWKQIHKRVILPTEEEILINARSRSAKLRLAIRLR